MNLDKVRTLTVLRTDTRESPVSPCGSLWESPGRKGEREEERGEVGGSGEAFLRLRSMQVGV